MAAFLVAMKAVDSDSLLVVLMVCDLVDSMADMLAEQKVEMWGADLIQLMQ